MIPSYLPALLSDTRALPTAEGPARLVCESLGTLRFPSGKVVACDPLSGITPLAFAVSVPAGNHPLRLSTVHGSDGEEMTAAAWLRFGDGTPVRWEHARWAGGRQGREPAYAVDSGMGGFMSLEAAEALADDDEGLSDLIYGAMEPGGEPPRYWVILPVPGAKELDFAVFETGLGDGVYASYWGYDAGGKPLILLTDFDVLGLAEEEPARPAKPWWKFW